jgi:phage recombination protein Bet
MNTALATAEPARRSLVTKIAERFGVDADKMLTTLKATAFRQKPGTTITNEQMMALLVVADQYDLNPFTKEIYAFEDKGAIVPIVSVDGWSRIINTHPMLDGIEFRYSDDTVKPEGGKDCPTWCECLIYRKDRSKPIVVREYLDEVYRKPNFASPWQTHTKRFLRHKTLIQCSRVAFGFAGIYDPDEGDRIIEGRAHVVTESADVSGLAERLRQRGQAAIKHQPGDVIDSDASEVDATQPNDARMVSPVGIRARLEAADSLDALNDAAADIEMVEDVEVRKELVAFYVSQAEALK